LFIQGYDILSPDSITSIIDNYMDSGAVILIYPEYKKLGYTFPFLYDRNPNFKNTPILSIDDLDNLDSIIEGDSMGFFNAIKENISSENKETCFAVFFKNKQEKITVLNILKKLGYYVDEEYYIKEILDVIYIRKDDWGYGSKAMYPAHERKYNMMKLNIDEIEDILVPFLEGSNMGFFDLKTQ